MIDSPGLPILSLLHDGAPEARVLERVRVDAALGAEASEPEFRRLVESIPHLVWSLNADASEAYLSPRWLEYTGQPASLSLAEAWLAAIYPDDHDRCLAEWARARAERTPWQIEYRLRRHDGEYHWHLGRGVPHCDADGAILRWYGTATDIHEQRKAVRSRDDLIATVSHDLRGPLSAILLAAESLEESNPDRYEIGIIHRAVKNMERLVRDLLDMASIESGQLTITAAPSAVDKLVDEALETIQRTAAAKPIAIEKSVAGSPLRVHCDRGRILQVLGNLLGNAVKFTPADGHLSVRAALAGRFVLFAVSDTGPGIAPSQVPYVFDRFWRAKDNAKAGTGLGLAICKGIVEQHGGTIWVESQPGSGATFFFTLPRADGEPRDDRSPRHR
jgi:PAS domain S-box-containing protein